MLLVSGLIPECSTQESFTAAYSRITTLSAVAMGKPEPENTEFEKLVEAALKVGPKGLSGKHKGTGIPKKGKLCFSTPKPDTQ